MKAHPLLYILLATLPFLTKCGENMASNPATVAEPVSKKVKTVKAAAIDYRESIFASGILSEKEEVRLSFKTGGIVRQIFVTEGQVVKAGQVLAILDMNEINAHAQQALLSVQQAEINIRNASLAEERAAREYKNVQGLYADSVATYEQLHDAELQLKNARNQLEASKKGLNYARQNEEVAGFNMKHASIIAPANGIILKKLAESGEVVGPGMPVLLFGSAQKGMVLKVSLTDKDIIFVKQGDEAEVQFDAYAGQIFAGKVVEIAGMADPLTNTYEVEIEVKNDGKKLLSGFIGSVKILTTASRKLVEIPVDALLRADGKQCDIFIMDGGKAKKIQVEVFRIKDDKLLVEKGLEDGQAVIVEGGGFLEDRDPVVVGQL